MPRRKAPGGPRSTAPKPDPTRRPGGGPRPRKKPRRPPRKLPEPTVRWEHAPVTAVVRGPRETFLVRIHGRSRRRLAVVGLPAGFALAGVATAHEGHWPHAPHVLPGDHFVSLQRTAPDGSHQSRLYRIRLQQGVHRARLVTAHDTPLRTLAFSPQGTLYASTGSEILAVAFGAGGSSRLEFAGRFTGGLALPYIAFAPDGRLFGVREALESTTLHELDYVAPMPLEDAPVEPPFDRIRSVRIHPSPPPAVFGFTFAACGLVFASGGRTLRWFRLDLSQERPLHHAPLTPEDAAGGVILEERVSASRSREVLLDVAAANPPGPPGTPALRGVRGGGSRVRPAPRPSPVAEYLDRYPKVRAAIAWRVLGKAGERRIAYADWGKNAVTRPFRDRLELLYGHAACGHPIPFLYLSERYARTGERRFAPELREALHQGKLFEDALGLRDASDIYLAHLAQSLWIQIHGVVPWQLHQYSPGQLRVLLDGGDQFRPADSAPGLYLMNRQRTGLATPGDPTASFRFLAGSDPALRPGPSFLRPSALETVHAFARWCRDRLAHGYNPAPDVPGLEPHVLYHPKPVGSMIRRTHLPAQDGQGAECAAYWTLDGCVTTTGLWVWALRTVNIPASHIPTPLGADANGGVMIHGALDLPSLALLLEHTDLIYATPQIADPAIEPAAVFNMGKADYRARRARMVAAPADWAAWNRSFRTELVEVAFRNATPWIVTLYIASLASGAHPQTFLDSLAAEGPSPQHALELYQANPAAVQRIQVRIAEFRVVHAARIQDALLQLAPGIHPDWALYTVFSEVHAEWLQARPCS